MQGSASNLLGTAVKKVREKKIGEARVNTVLWKRLSIVECIEPGKEGNDVKGCEGLHYLRQSPAVFVKRGNGVHREVDRAYSSTAKVMGQMLTLTHILALIRHLY